MRSERIWYTARPTKEEKYLTDPLFFDTDCLSAFLWVGHESLLEKLYPGRVVIPKSVYDELSVPGIAHLKRRVDTMLQAGTASVMQIDYGTPEYLLYRKLTSDPEPGHHIIGRGEAAAIAWAKSQDGILASNNLKDISVYVTEWNLQHVTTGDVLFAAYQKGFIDEAQGNVLWANMLAKRRRLGYGSFSDYLRNKSNR